MFKFVCTMVLLFLLAAAGVAIYYIAFAIKATFDKFIDYKIEKELKEEYHEEVKRRFHKEMAELNFKTTK